MRKYLLARTDHLGDVLFAFPVAMRIKQAEPGAQVFMLVSHTVGDLVKASPFVDGMVACDDAADEVIVDRIQALRCDIFLALDGFRRSAQLAYRAQIPVRIGSAGRLHHWWYNTKRVFFSRKRSDLHEAQLNCCLLKPLGFYRAESRDALIPGCALHVAGIDLSTLGLKNQKFNLIFHPGSHGNGREWPVGNWVALANALPSERFQIIVTGIEAEKARFESLRSLPQVVDLMGQLPLSTFLSLLASVDGLVASGTGPLHIAAALDKPVLGLFPPLKTAGPLRWSPLGTKADFLVKPEPCVKKCLNGACPCMQAITVEQVESKVLAW